MRPGWPAMGAPTGPAAPTEPASSWRWATVTQASPLRIKFDGQSAELPVTPDTLVSGLVVDDRVWVQIYGRRPIIHGRAGG